MEYSYLMSYVISNLGVLVAIFILNKYLFIYAVIVSLIIFAINKKRLRRQYEIEKDLKVLQEKKTSLFGYRSLTVRGWCCRWQQRFFCGFLLLPQRPAA